MVFEAIDQFIPISGFECEFPVDAEGRIFHHQWRVIEVQPERLISYEWKYRNVQGTSTVEWRLASDASGTLLTLTHRGTESFPQDDPIFSRQSAVDGWRYLVCESLDTFVTNQT